MPPLLTTTKPDWTDCFFAFYACERVAYEAQSLSKIRMTEITRTQYQHKLPTLPTIADFLADFSLAARAVLMKQEYVVFQAVYIKRTLSESEVPAKHVENIVHLVGAEVLRRQIYGSGYFFRHSTAIEKEEQEQARQELIAEAREKRMLRKAA